MLRSLFITEVSSAILVAKSHAQKYPMTRCKLDSKLLGERHQGGHMSAVPYLVSGYGKSSGLFHSTPAALNLFSPTRIAFPKMGIDEVKYRGRRLAPRPVMHLGRGDHRQRVWQNRFKELGGSIDRVWVALGGRMKRRRIGKPKNIKDMRYYWRPIEQYAQRTYMKKLRTRFRNVKWKAPLTLRANNREIGQNSTGQFGFHKTPFKKFAGSSPPKKLDFEFRVY